jgi:tyrosyl-tRNA synthetase
MSKSLNNYIGIDESPNEMFGKVMSISDDLMWRYYDLVTDLTPSEISNFKSEISDGRNPRDTKVNLAKLIIKDFHSEADAIAAEDEFNRRFVKKEIPDEIEEVSIAAQTYRLADLVVASGLVATKGEARRLIEQGGIRINGEKATAGTAEIDLSGGDSLILQVGKLKFAKLTGNS